MRIGVDVNDLARPMSGLGRYTLSLLKAMKRLELKSTYFLFHKNQLSNAMEEFTGQRDFVLCHSPSRSETLWSQVWLPLDAIKNNIDVLFCPTMRAPFLHSCPTVMTIHDLLFLKYPQFFPRFDRVYMSWMLSLVSRSCNHFITVSESTRSDIIDILGIPPGRITTIYEGVDDVFAPVEKDFAREQLAQENIIVPRQYILYVGTIEPRKNLTNLLLAYVRARQHGIQHKLVIAGKRGWLAEDFWRLLYDQEKNGHIIYLGHIPDRLLPLLYAASDLFVYPSLYEGFGLPPLEAMACGVPVLVNDTPALVEICGTAAEVVDAQSIDSFTNALESLAVDSLHRRTLVQRGFERTKMFSWKSSAQSTFEILSRATDGSRLD